MKLFWKHASDGVCVRRSLKVALVVGTILASINHFDMFVTQKWEALRFIQIAVTYLVPYAVATFGSAMQARHIELSSIVKNL